MPAGLDSGVDTVTPKEKRVKQKQTVDNPGEGNCAFYAFANGLIHIIQEAGSDRKMFERWAELDPDVKGLYDDIRKFDFHNWNRKLLETLQQSLRNITSEYKLAEIRKACVASSSRLAKILEDCAASDKLAEVFRTCATADEKYIKLIQVCTTQDEMLAELIRVRLGGKENTDWHKLLLDCAKSNDLFADLFKACAASKDRMLELLKASQKSGVLCRVLRVRDSSLKLDELLKKCGDATKESEKEVLAEVHRVCKETKKFPSLVICSTPKEQLAELKRICASDQQLLEMRSCCDKSEKLTQLFRSVDTSDEQFAELRRVCTPGSADLSELRRIFVISLIDNPYTIFSATSSYANFALVYSGMVAKDNKQLRPEDVDPRFNEYAEPKIVSKLFSNLDASTVKTHNEDQVLVPLYMKLLYGTNDVAALTEQTKPKESSPILEAIKKITENYFWGTHTDLDYLANAFKTNLHTLHDGKSQEFRDLPDRPTVTIRNRGGFHWVTIIEVDKPEVVKEKPLSGVLSGSGGDAKPSEASAIGLRPAAGGSTSPSAPGLGLDSGPQVQLEPVAKPQPVSHSNDNAGSQIAALARLSRLKSEINHAINDYHIHSNSIWFCFFHVHGETGRKRASNFRNEVGSSSTYQELMKKVHEFLSDKKNGNTHPHSFRTMLLHQLLGPESGLTLEQLSKSFSAQLEKYKSSTATTVKHNRAPGIMSN